MRSITTIGRFAILAFLSLAMLASTTNAQEVFVLSGNHCSPSNSAAKDKVIRKVSGSIKNVSTTSSAKLSCPIIGDAFGQNISILLFATNNDDRARKFVCTLQELDVIDRVERSIKKGVTMIAGGFGNVDYEEYTLADETNRWDLTCTLPPLSVLGSILMATY